jgi:hypothetical protein
VKFNNPFFWFDASDPDPLDIPAYALKNVSRKRLHIQVGWINAFSWLKFLEKELI